jgi:apolipoprotein N-acyltransferase
MPSVIDLRRAAFGSLAALATAGMVWFGSGLHPLWPLMWLAPLPVLLFAARASWKAALPTALAAWFVGNLNQWHYYTHVIEMPLGAVIGICFALSAVFTLAVLLQRALLLRQDHWSALLAFPAIWASAEYVISLTSPHGTAASLAYTQLNFLPLLQLASVTGPWGITFVLTLFPSAISVTAHVGTSSSQQAKRILLVSATAVAMAVGFGALRLLWPTHGETIKVGLIASDPPTSPPVPAPGAETAALLDGYAEEATKLATAGAQVIVLPEKIGIVDEEGTAAVDARFQRLADALGAQIVVGLVTKPSTRTYNEARWYLPSLTQRSYDKQHMLPPFESNLTPGTALSISSERSGTRGVEICKDMDFISPARAYGRAGVGVMLVPAWDFVADRFSHGHMAVMRGVENGFTVVRAAKMGYLTVSDDRGRILAETPSNSAPFATLLVEVPTTHHSTAFLLLGDWFGWMSLAMLSYIVGRYLVRSREVRRAVATTPGRHLGDSRLP